MLNYVEHARDLGDAHAHQRGRGRGQDNTNSFTLLEYAVRHIHALDASSPALKMVEALPHLPEASKANVSELRGLLASAECFTIENPRIHTAIHAAFWAAPKRPTALGHTLECCRQPYARLSLSNTVYRPPLVHYQSVL